MLRQLFPQHSELSQIGDLADFPLTQEQITANANRATAFTKVLSRFCSTGTACTPLVLSVSKSNFASKHNPNSLIL